MGGGRSGGGSGCWCCVLAAARRCGGYDEKAQREPARGSWHLRGTREMPVGLAWVTRTSPCELNSRTAGPTFSPKSPDSSGSPRRGAGLRPHACRPTGTCSGMPCRPRPRHTPRRRLTSASGREQPYFTSGRQAHNDQHPLQHRQPAHGDQEPGGRPAPHPLRRNRPYRAETAPPPGGVTDRDQSQPRRDDCQPPEQEARARTLCRCRAGQRDCRANQNHRADVRRQAADEPNDQRPPILLAPALNRLGSPTCRTARNVIIVTHARESTPGPNPALRALRASAHANSLPGARPVRPPL